MPLYHFRCLTCDKPSRRFLEPAQAAGEVLCRTCKNPLQRTPQAPTSQVVERLDNGLMVKAIERPADAERLYRERAEAATEAAKKNV